MLKLFFLFFLPVVLLSQNTYYEYGEKVTLTPLESPSLSPALKSLSTQKQLTFYKTTSNITLGVDGTLLAKCKEDCIGTFKLYGVDEYKEISPKTYLVKTPQNKELFSLSVELYESGAFVYVHPNFYIQRELR